MIESRGWQASLDGSTRGGSGHGLVMTCGTVAMRNEDSMNSLREALSRASRQMDG